jgi:membrane fusion protein, multidrug efflux system
MAVETSLATSPQGGERRRMLLIVAVAFVVIGILWALYYFLVLTKREKTDDAYVGGNKVAISSQIAGTVTAVLADETRLVKAGQVLVKLDPTDAQTGLAHAEANLAQAVRLVRQQTSQAGQFDSTIESRRLELARAEEDLAKREPLLADKAIAPEELRHAKESVALARAALNQALRESQAAHALVDGTPIPENPSVLVAKAAYRDAWITAQRTAIIAPVTGYVASRAVQLGARIEPGQNLMAVIPLTSLWVDANFKEEQLRHLRLGQPAEVRSDLYGGDAIFHGRVAGVGAGTGAAFALLPPQNASGNWIKIVQRVPVRIELDRKELETHPLRIGLSTTVTVDVRDRSGPILATVPESHEASTSVYAQDFAAANAAAERIVDANMAALR